MTYDEEAAQAIQNALEFRSCAKNCLCYFLEDWPLMDGGDWLYVHAQILAQRLRLAESFKNPRKGPAIWID